MAAMRKSLMVFCIEQHHLESTAADSPHLSVEWQIIVVRSGVVCAQ